MSGLNGTELRLEPNRLALVITLGACWFLVAANILTVPALLHFLDTDLDLSPFELMAVVSVLPLASFAGNVLFGPLIDIVGRRRCLLIGTFGAAVTIALTAIAPNGTVIIALRLVTGLLMPLVGVSVFPSIASYVPEKHRMSVTGYVVAGGSLAQLLTTPLLIALADLSSWRWAFLGLAAVAVAACFGVLAFLPALRRSGQGLRDYRLRSLIPPAVPSLRGVVTAFWVFTFSMFVVTSLYPTWLIGQRGDSGEVGAVSTLFLVSGVAAVVCASATGMVARRSPRVVPIILMAAPVLMVLALPALPENYAVQLAAYTLLLGAQAMVFPFLRGRANSLAGDKGISTVNASLNAGYQIAAAVAAAVSGLLYGLAPAFWLNALLAGVGFALTALIFARASSEK